MSNLRPVAVTPHLFVRNTDEAVSFYGKAFGAVELFRNSLPDGRVLFVELALGQGRVLLSEETPSLNALAPPTIGGSPVMLLIEVEDVDGLSLRAVEAGAEVEMPVQEMFWGERYGVLVDPFGHRWAISTVREQLTPDDIASRTPPDIQPSWSRQSHLDQGSSNRTVCSELCVAPGSMADSLRGETIGPLRLARGPTPRRNYLSSCWLMWFRGDQLRIEMGRRVSSTDRAALSHSWWTALNTVLHLVVVRVVGADPSPLHKE